MQSKLRRYRTPGHRESCALRKEIEGLDGLETPAQGTASAQDIFNAWNELPAVDAEADAAMEAEEDTKEIEIEGLDMLPQRQMAIRTMEDGRMYVENDRTVIAGNNPDMWRDQVMDYINNEIRHGKDVTFYGADGAPLTITEDTAGKARFRNMVTMPDGTSGS